MRVESPQTNRICERFHKTMLQESHWMTYDDCLYRDFEELQQDLDAWIVRYEEEQTREGRICWQWMLMTMFEDGMKIWADK